MCKWLNVTSQWENAKHYNTTRALNAFYLDLMLPNLDWRLTFESDRTVAQHVEEIALVSSMNTRLLSKLIKTYHKKLGAAITARIGDYYLTLKKKEQVWATQAVSYEGSSLRLQPIRGVEPSEEVWRDLTPNEIGFINNKRSQRNLSPLEDFLDLNGIEATMWNRVMIDSEQWSVGRSMLHLERTRKSLSNTS